MTKILIKRLSKEVSLPKYETNGSSGMDLAADIDANINIDPGKLSLVNVILSSDIYIPILGFIFMLLVGLIIKKLFFKKN